jgi:hypothetical protein
MMFSLYEAERPTGTAALPGPFRVAAARFPRRRAESRCFRAHSDQKRAHGDEPF